MLLVGGGARSEALRRIAPAVLGHPVAAPPAAEYVADGAARQAAWALAGGPAPPRWELAGTRPTRPSQPRPSASGMRPAATSPSKQSETTTQPARILLPLTGWTTRSRGWPRT